jgi:hypothetical protein
MEIGGIDPQLLTFAMELSVQDHMIKCLPLHQLDKGLGWPQKLVGYCGE